MRRTLAVAYGVASYLVFQFAFLYAIGFVGNLVVPKSVNSGTGGPPGYCVFIQSLLLVPSVKEWKWPSGRPDADRFPNRTIWAIISPERRTAIGARNGWNYA
jgi:hypothetical protein